MKTIIYFFLSIPFVLTSFTLVCQDLPCKEKYENERCKERYREDENGNPHGKFISYLSNGNIERLGYYIHGIPQGNWKLYHPFGYYFYTWYEKGKSIGSNSSPINSFSEAVQIQKKQSKEEADELWKHLQNPNSEMYGFRYEDFVTKFPSDSRVPIAKEKIAEKELAKCSSLECLRDFIEKYKSGKSVELAKAEIKKLEKGDEEKDLRKEKVRLAQSCKSLEDYNKLKRTFSGDSEEAHLLSIAENTLIYNCFDLDTYKILTKAFPSNELLEKQFAKIQTNTNQPITVSHIVITSPTGAPFFDKAEMNSQMINTIIPTGTKLEVEKVEKRTSSAGEDDEMIFYFYQVTYKNATGYVKGEDTDFNEGLK